MATPRARPRTTPWTRSGDPAECRRGRRRGGRTARGVEIWKSGILKACGTEARGRFSDFQVFNAGSRARAGGRWEGSYARALDRRVIARRDKSSWPPRTPPAQRLPAGCCRICVSKSRDAPGGRRDFFLAAGQGWVKIVEPAESAMTPARLTAAHHARVRWAGIPRVAQLGHGGMKCLRRKLHRSTRCCRSPRERSCRAVYTRWLISGLRTPWVMLRKAPRPWPLQSARIPRL